MATSLEPDQQKPPPPSANRKGFHTPDEDVKRRNHMTALIILALIACWLLIGFHQAYCNS